MNTIKEAFDVAKRLYDIGDNPLDAILRTVAACQSKLARYSLTRYGGCSAKEYSIYAVGGQKSRPILPNLFITDSGVFQEKWSELIACASGESHKFNIAEAEANATIYTAVMSFCVCYDLWKPASRKTPGTFFEVVLGSLLALILPEATRTKFISLPPPPRAQGLLDSEEGISAGSVSTDIVFNFPGNMGIVIPAKITTRERIVQPFAHQRILDSAMGEGRYVSLLTCVSETQRDDEDQSVNEICVPGTIVLFQEYLAKLGGIYYLDPPRRYLRLNDEGVIEVASVGALVTEKLATLISRLQTSPPAPRS
jgi:hypothetical protein